MGENFSALLSEYRLRILKVIALLDSFIDGGKIGDLADASELLIKMGSESYGSFEFYSHAILPAISIEAGLGLRKRVREMRVRGVRKEDREYVSDVCQVFKVLEESIGSGEYEKEYANMVKKARGLNRIAG